MNHRRGVALSIRIEASELCIGMFLDLLDWREVTKVERNNGWVKVWIENPDKTISSTLYKSHTVVRVRAEPYDY